MEDQTLRIELLPGMTNVVRFPVERRARPTLELLRDIVPDVRDVSSIAEAFDFDTPVAGLRGKADQETAEHILNAYPSTLPHRLRLLDELLAPVVTRAIEACRTAHDASVVAAEAQQLLLAARTAGGYWIEPMVERAQALTLRAAQLLIEAHTRAEEALGAARAVGMAQRGEPWTPRDEQDEDDALLTMGRLAG